MTAKEFWNTQVPTDANKCYVHDYYARKFSHEDLFRFAEAYASLKVAEATKEMYPKAFIEWVVINCRAEGNTNLWLYNYDDKTETYLNAGTTDELCEYWKQNIQGICQMMISPAAQEIAAKTDEAIPLEDLKQYMTNLLYYAYDEGNKGIDGSQFDKWVEERVGEIREYFKSEKSFKVAEATKDMYPRSFIEWKDVNARRVIRKYVDNPIDTWFQIGLKEDMSFDELFKYWKQNINK